MSVTLDGPPKMMVASAAEACARLAEVVAAAREAVGPAAAVAAAVRLRERGHRGQLSQLVAEALRVVLLIQAIITMRTNRSKFKARRTSATRRLSLRG
jgi:hypothetical protein